MAGTDPSIDRAKNGQRIPDASEVLVESDIPVCQSNLPSCGYQEQFKTYAEEYLALPDHQPETVLPWMESYVRPALAELGSDLVLLAHYYMGGAIVRLVERYGGKIGDSYELAREVERHREKRLFVESAVHFMVESIAILAEGEQEVYITNPRAGCTLEMMAKEFMVRPALWALQERYGDDLLIVVYMNTSGRLKALAGQTGGAVCTSSNSGPVLAWALARRRKVVFFPDRNLGENTAAQLSIPPESVYLLPGGYEGRDIDLGKLPAHDLRRLDRAKLILWGGFCGVHTVFEPSQVAYWQQRGYRVLVHPESPREVAAIADGAGSTSYLWKRVMAGRAGDRFAVGTDGHFVRNLRGQAAQHGIHVVHLADIPGVACAGCGCATMARSDPAHLVGTLDLLGKGKIPQANRVLPGDIVDEFSGTRCRLPPESRGGLVRDARIALRQMIEITESVA
jgi:quinolinate synthase